MKIVILIKAVIIKAVILNAVKDPCISPLQLPLTPIPKPL
jgi:hypothetical protein